MRRKSVARRIVHNDVPDQVCGSGDVKKESDECQTVVSSAASESSSRPEPASVFSSSSSNKKSTAKILMEQLSEASSSVVKMQRPFRSRRKGTGPSTGLRAVSVLVVQYLSEHPIVTYDTLANSVCSQLKSTDEDSEERNIRRRTYDVINIMAAMGVIKKHKKRLFSVQSLVGPNEMGTANFYDLQLQLCINEKNERLKRIEEKTQAIEQLMQTLPVIRDCDVKREIGDEEQDGQTDQAEAQTTDRSPEDYYLVQALSSLPAASAASGSESGCNNNVLVAPSFAHSFAQYELIDPADADPNLQDVSARYQTPATNADDSNDSLFTRDPVDAIISAFY